MTFQMDRGIAAFDPATLADLWAGLSLFGLAMASMAAFLLPAC